MKFSWKYNYAKLYIFIFNGHTISNVLYIHTIINANGHIFSACVYALKRKKGRNSRGYLEKKKTPPSSSHMYKPVIL